jgi:hypothetical protein
MSDAAAVTAIVLFLIFFVGIAVGVVTVIAMSARRRADRESRPQGPAPRAQSGWPNPDEPGSDDDPPDEPGWWQAGDGR